MIAGKLQRHYKYKDNLITICLNAKEVKVISVDEDKSRADKKAQQLSAAFNVLDSSKEKLSPPAAHP